VYNVQGQLVNRVDMISASKSIELKLSAGLYHVQCESNKGLITKKVIVQ